MGLSSKQVSSDQGQGWDQALLQANETLELPKHPPSSIKRHSSQQQQQQQQQQQSEPLKCPRCDSTNTKFCYYNNYNKSQPRHFCKSCKRHWTKGGTLRNVPVGGGRKNKRHKASAATTKGGGGSSKTIPTNTTTTNTTTNTTSTSNRASSFLSGITNNNMAIQAQELGVVGGGIEKSFSEAFYQTLGRQPTSSLPESSFVFSGKRLNDADNGIFQDLQFPYSNLGGFESNPCSISSTISSIQQPSNLYSYTGEQSNGLEETVMNSLNNTTSMSSSSMSDHQQQQQHQQWTMPSTTTTNCGVMDMTSNWGWDDFDKFVSVEADLTIPWDDAEIQP